MRNRKAQISFEYLVIMGFITFVIIGVMGVALLYSGGIKDRIRITQMNNCANKILSTAESVFYAGEPSRATITCYMPEGIKNIEVYEPEQSIIISIQTSSGTTTTAFTSNVPIAEGSESLQASAGVKRIKVIAEENKAVISPA